VSTSFQNGLLAAVPNLRAFAMSLSGNASRADDLVQDTLVKAWANRASYQEGTNLNAWLFTILRNTYYSLMRKRRREVEDVDEAAAAALKSPAQQLDHLHLQDLTEALQTLPPTQREAIILVAASGMSYEEAAEICNTAPGTIKSRVSRARKRLAELLDGQHPDVTDDGSSSGLQALAV